MVRAVIGTPYRLDMFGSVFLGQGTVPVMGLTRLAADWRRSIHYMRGSDLGSFTLTGTDEEMAGYYWTWLAKHVQETVSGQKTWTGFVAELDLLGTNGVQRRRSLFSVANAVQTSYLTQDFVGDNMMHNPSFEDVGAGGADVFAAWYEETAGAGAIARSIAEHYDGAASLEITSDGDLDTFARQNLSVTPGQVYRLRFYYKGTMRYEIDDPNIKGSQANPIELHSPSGWSMWTWDFLGPSDGEVLIIFYGGRDSGDVGYVDLVSVLEKQDTVKLTDWATDDDSINRYGRQETKLQTDNYPADTAEDFRDTYLAGNAWPWPRPVAIRPGKQATLTVSLAGYAYTGNWLYTLTGSGSDLDLDDRIIEIVGTAYGLSAQHEGGTESAGDCQFLKTGQIAANTIQVPSNGSGEGRPWDALVELAMLGDSSQNLYRVFVDHNREVQYRQIETTPKYYLKSMGLTNRLGGTSVVSPWLVTPGVVRDLSFVGTGVEPGSFLDDPRDSFVEEVEMAAGWPKAMLKTSLFEEADLIAAQTDMLLAARQEEPKRGYIGDIIMPDWGGR